MRKMIIAIVTVALLATSGLAMAQGWGRGAGKGPGYGPGGCVPGVWAAALNLSTEQVQAMQALRESQFQETIPLRDEMMNKRLELRTLWAQTNPDQEKILAKQREINALRTQLQEKATKHRLEMRQILTAEQQTKLGSILSGPAGIGPGYGMRGGFGLGRGMGMGFGPCYR
ncbi:MAG: periplasmic heavy metal sensor [Deltaproteobacteria bacterium]|nr:periplasmic heavy metal sensor [Deltaproteobacteria bacterium]